MNSVPAARGIDWIVESVKLIFKNPLVFLGIGLVLSLLVNIPLLNLLTGLALLVLGPTVLAGLIHAARREADGSGASFEDIGYGFTSGKIGSLIILALPGIAIGVLAVVIVGTLLVLGLGAAFASGGGDGGSAIAGMTVIVMLLVGFLFLIAAIVNQLLLFFGVTDVAYTETAPIDAMKSSLAACFSNIGAVLLALIISGVALVVVAMLGAVITSLIPLIGFLLTWLFTVALAAVVYPYIGALMYHAYRDVYGFGGAAAAPPPAPMS